MQTLEKYWFKISSKFEGVIAILGVFSIVFIYVYAFFPNMGMWAEYIAKAIMFVIGCAPIAAFGAFFVAGILDVMKSKR
jgi:uncharacterized membrane protein HdeD (DUF308 family)